jgi:hypothetical protein
MAVTKICGSEYRLALKDTVNRPPIAYQSIGLKVGGKRRGM